MTKPVRPIKLGLAYFWQPPGKSGLAIVWPWPGAGLLIGVAFDPGAPMLPIKHPSANGKYADLASADAAVQAYLLS